MPRREEPGERGLLDRLDLFAQRRQRPTTQLSQDIDLTKLARDTLGPKLTEDHPIFTLERRQRTGDALWRCSESTGHVGVNERAVSTGEPAHEFFEGPRHRLGERHWQTERNRAPECIAIPRCIFTGDVANFASHRNLDGAFFTEQLSQPLHSPFVRLTGRSVLDRCDLDPSFAIGCLHFACCRRFVSCGSATQVNFGCRQVAHLAQHIMQLVSAARPATGCQTLQLQLDIGEHVGVK